MKKKRAIHEYDVTLKKLLQTSADTVLSQTLGDLHIGRWLNVELLPAAQTRRADLVGETIGDGLVHIELQSSNDPTMPLRMAEYALRICRKFGELPRQLVLYVGKPALRMSASLQGSGEGRPDFSFRYTLCDVRDLDGMALLSSTGIENNLLSILARLRDQRAAVQEILTRIANQDEPRRRELFANFLVLSGLRELEETTLQEAQKMPVLNSILDHKVIGPAILQGRAEGLEEGRQRGLKEGRNQGRTEGLADISRRLLEKRFGPLPAWVNARLKTLSPSELEDLPLQLFDASTLDSLFPR